jgi:dTMP kinase
LWPHHVVLLDAPTEVLAERIRGRQLDRFELAGADFHERVAAGFRAMASDDPEHWTVVDAGDGPSVVAARVRAAVASLVGP